MSADSPVSILFSSAALEVANKSNNTAAPDASNIGVLPVVATAAAPTYVEGRLAALSADLSGRLRVDATVSSGFDRTATGIITAAQDVAINTQASGACSIQVTGVWTGTLLFEATANGTDWVAVNGVVPDTGVEQSSTTANGLWIVACAGFSQVRVRGNTVTVGTATIFLESSTATQVVILGDPLPTGSNVIGAVTQSAGPWTVAGTKTNNAAVPGATNVGVLGAIANAAAPTWAEGNLVGMSVDLAGNLRTSATIAANSSVNVNQIAGTATSVNNGTADAGTLRVTIASDSTGQVTLATGANTIGKVDQGTAGASAWLVTGAGGTFPITAASLPLPTGASTAAKQPALGTAGTASADVITVQGIAGMTALTVAGAKSNNGGVPGSTNLGVLPVVATAAAPSYTEGNQAALSTDLAGNLRTSTSIAANSSVNVNQIAGTTTAVNNGVVSAGVQRVTIASDSTGQVALAAGTADVGKIRFSLPTTDAMTEAVINFTATGDNTVVALTAAQTIRVFRMFFVVDGNTNITIKDATAGTALTGAMSMSKGGGMTLDLSGEPWFTSASGANFVISQSGTAQVSGRCYYTKS